MRASVRRPEHTVDTSPAVQSPQSTDFYAVRSLLDEDERMIQDAVARFVDDRVLPLIAPAFEEGRFPSELVPEMAEMGLLGCNIEGYGCACLSQVCYGLVSVTMLSSSYGPSCRRCIASAACSRQRGM